MKKILYIDMDNVLVDFVSAKDRLPEGVWDSTEDKDDIEGIFSLMDPMPGAIDAFIALSNKYDTYILSTSPWANDTAMSEKHVWVKKYLGEPARKLVA